MSKILDAETVTKIAKLARLTDNPSAVFLEKYGKELGAILDYIEQLQQIDTTGISPTDGLRTIAVDQLREDIPFVDEGIRERIIANFPIKKGNLLEVPGIFE